MKMMFKNVAFATIFFLGMGCRKDDNGVRQAEFIIASTYEQCKPSFNSTTTHCLKITEMGDPTPYNIEESAIRGFNYEPGFKYKILVKLTRVDNPPADGSNTNYELIEVISKTRD